MLPRKPFERKPPALPAHGSDAHAALLVLPVGGGSRSRTPPRPSRAAESEELSVLDRSPLRAPPPLDGAFDDLQPPRRLLAAPVRGGAPWSTDEAAVGTATVVIRHTPSGEGPAGQLPVEPGDIVLVLSFGLDRPDGGAWPTVRRGSPDGGVGVVPLFSLQISAGGDEVSESGNDDPGQAALSQSESFAALMRPEPRAEGGKGQAAIERPPSRWALWCGHLKSFGKYIGIHLHTIPTTT